jgi:hypothetical protein
MTHASSGAPQPFGLALLQRRRRLFTQSPDLGSLPCVSRFAARPECLSGGPCALLAIAVTRVGDA